MHLLFISFIVFIISLHHFSLNNNIRRLIPLITPINITIINELKEGSYYGKWNANENFSSIKSNSFFVIHLDAIQLFLRLILTFFYFYYSSTSLESLSYIWFFQSSFELAAYELLTNEISSYVHRLFNFFAYIFYRNQDNGNSGFCSFC